MYALSVHAEVEYYLCVPPDPSIEAAALGATEYALPGTAPAEALHTFTLDSGASRYFFRDSFTLTPLPAPVPVRLADRTRGPVLAHSSTVLLCPAVPSGSLSGLHLPSFSTNLVSSAALQVAMVTTTTPGGQRVSICTSIRTGRHLATFTRRPGSSLYTLATEPPQTLLWHHRLGHPSLPRLRGMHSHLLVSGLPRSLHPLPPSPAPPCLPCVKGRQRAAPHSSSFPPTTSPLQTFHMDVWGPARVSGQDRERYFLLVVDDYTRYTTVFPLHCKGEVPSVLIPWIRAVRLQLREQFRADLPVLRLHPDRGGEFSSDLLREICRREGILHSFTLTGSPQQNGIAERRIGLVMRRLLNLWPRVSLLETLPTLHLTGKVGDASVFRSVPFYCLFPYCTTSLPPLPLLLVPGPPPVDPLPPQGLALAGVSQVDPLPNTVPFEAAPAGVEPGGADSEGAGSGGAKPWGAEPGGTEPVGAEPGGAARAVAGGTGAGAAGGTGAASLGGARTGGTGAARVGGHVGVGAGGNGVGAAGAGAAGGSGAAGPRVARTRGTGAAGASGVAGVGAGDPRAKDPGARGAGPGGAGAVGASSRDTGRLQPYFVPLLQQILGLPSSNGLTPPLLCLPLDQSQPLLQPASPLPTPSPYTKQIRGLKERREPVSCPALPVHVVRTGHRVPR
ncbi:unnamed protein product [Closterium sp. NIES-53]